MAGLVAIATLSLHCCQLLVRCKYRAIQHVIGLQRHPNNLSLKAHHRPAGRFPWNPSRFELFTDHLVKAKAQEPESSDATENGRSGEVQRRLVKEMQYGDLARMCVGRWGLALTNALIVITQIGFCVNYAIFASNAVLTFFPTYNCTVQPLNSSAVMTSPDCQFLSNSPWRPWVEGLKNSSGARGNLSHGFVHVEGITEPPTAVSGQLGDLSNSPKSDWRTITTQRSQTDKAYTTTLSAGSSASQNSGTSLGDGRTALILANTVTNASTRDQQTFSATFTSASLASTPDSTPSTLTPRNLTSAPASTDQSFTLTSTLLASTNRRLTSASTPPASANQRLTSASSLPASTNQSSSSTVTPPASSDGGSPASATSTVPSRAVWSQIWAAADLRVMFLFPVPLFVLLVLPKRLRGLGVISVVGNLGLLTGIAVTLASLIARRCFTLKVLELSARAEITTLLYFLENGRCFPKVPNIYI